MINVDTIQLINSDFQVQDGVTFATPQPCFDFRSVMIALLVDGCIFKCNNLPSSIVSVVSLFSDDVLTSNNFGTSGGAGLEIYANTRTHDVINASIIAYDYSSANKFTGVSDNIIVHYGSPDHTYSCSGTCSSGKSSMNVWWIVILSIVGAFLAVAFVFLFLCGGLSLMLRTRDIQVITDTIRRFKDDKYIKKHK
jgi:hypothetical protein